MDKEKVIKGMEFTKAMLTFNPTTGDEIAPENLNELDKITYDACVGAIALLKEQETANIYKCPNCGTWVSAENVVRCKDCKWGDWSRNGFGENMILCYNGNTGIEDGYLQEPDWFCAEGEKK